MPFNISPQVVKPEEGTYSQLDSNQMIDRRNAQIEGVLTGAANLYKQYQVKKVDKANREEYQAAVERGEFNFGSAPIDPVQRGTQHFREIAQDRANRVELTKGMDQLGQAQQFIEKKLQDDRVAMTPEEKTELAQYKAWRARYPNIEPTEQATGEFEENGEPRKELVVEHPEGTLPMSRYGFLTGREFQEDSQRHEARMEALMQMNLRYQSNPYAQKAIQDLVLQETASYKNRFDALKARAEVEQPFTTAREQRVTDKLRTEAEARRDLEVKGGTQIEAETAKNRGEMERDAAKARLEGTKKPDFSSVSSARGQFNTQSKTFQDVRDAIKNLKGAVALPQTAAGDMRLIFSYMKLQDPASSVREGEYANAQNAAGIPEQILNLYNKAKDGKILTAGQRADFYTQADSMANGYLESQLQLESEYSELAKRNNIDPRDVVIDFIPKEWRNKATAKPSSGTSNTETSAVVKKQYSPSQNKTRIVRADGTVEILDGRQ